MVFLGEIFFLSANLMGKMSVSDLGRKNILKALHALKKIVLVEEKNNVATSCREKTFPLWSEKKLRPHAH